MIILLTLQAVVIFLCKMKPRLGPLLFLAMTTGCCKLQGVQTHEFAMRDCQENMPALMKGIDK